MFDFWYEKFIARVIPSLVFMSFFGIFIYAFYTVITVPPADQAPFVQEMREVQAEKTSKNEIKLDVPHLTDNEIKHWITMVVSESLTFSKANYNEVLTSIKSYYNERGYKKYEQYLISSGIAESLRVNNYDMSVYIEEAPLLLTSSALGGVYKWLYQMPVVVSFFPKDVEAVAEERDKFINRSFTLRLQITRANVDDDYTAIQVDDWTVSPR